MSESSGPSFCPNCGAKLKPDAKFCTNCGYNLTQFNAQSQQQSAQEQPFQQQATQQRAPQPNPNVEAAKKYSTNYFSWLWESIKHPSDVDLEGNKFFGITSFILAALLIGITGMVALYRIIKELTLLINDLSSAISELNGQSDSNGSTFPNYPTGSGFTIFLKIFLIALIFMALFVLVGWLTRRYLIGDEHETYLGFATRLAGYTNLSLIFLLLGMVFIALLNTLSGAFLLFLFILLTSTVYSIGYAYTILEFKQTRGLDKVHALLIALIADGILTMILSSIVGASVI